MDLSNNLQKSKIYVPFNVSTVQNREEYFRRGNKKG